MSHIARKISSLVLLSQIPQMLSAATFTVTTSSDGTEASPIAGSLRAEIIASNGSAGPNFINFAVGTYIISLVSPLPPITTNVSINTVSPQSVTLTGTRGFYVGNSTTTTIQSVSFSDTFATGGSGGVGGGGAGAGLGGGLFVEGGTTVTVMNGSFANCLALGGAGGDGGVGTTAAGGGGGLGGAGGDAFASTEIGGGGGGGYWGIGGAPATGGGGGGGGVFGNGGLAARNVASTIGAGGGGGGNPGDGAAATNPPPSGGNGGVTGGGGGGAIAAGGGNAGSGSAPGANGDLTGNGGSGGLNGGGGGSAYDLTSVAFGHAGAGGTYGGGGGSSGYFAGGAGGFGGGGGAGATTGPSGGCAGGAGGFGGGGGACLNQTGGASVGGNGGFGGGGGGAGGGPSPVSGTGGFGGGAGGGLSGGGGAGFGGGLFVANLGNLTFTGSLSLSGNQAVPGIGGTSTSPVGAGGLGMGLGNDIFLMSGGSINFNHTGSVQISSVIASDQGAGGGSVLTGGITQGGVGMLTLSGANTYTGTTTVSNGTLSISAANNLGLSTQLTLGGGTFQATSSLTLTLPVVLTAASTNGISVSPMQTLILTGGIAASTGSIIKGSSGTLQLQGTNSYSGVTLVSMGALQAGAANTFSPSSAVTVSAGATLDLNNFNETIPSLTGAAGSFVTLGSGVGGTLTLTPASPTTFAGVISGNGGLTLNGAAIFSLSGANSYSGPTTIDAGTLQALAINTFSPSSAVTIPNSGATLALNTFNQTISSLSGVTGSLVTLGTGGVLTVTPSSPTTFAGVISGTNGGLTMQGSSIFTLTGVNTYTGPTTVTSGQLTVNGTILGTTTVASGATLNGTGTLDNLTNNGTVTPGNSIGTLNVIGNYVQNSGSTLDIEINPSGATDLLNVTGTVTVNPGASLVVLPDAGTYTVGTLYTIVTAGGGRSGTFSNVMFTVPTPRMVIMGEVIYNSNSIVLDILSSSVIPFTTLVTTSNAKSVAKCIDMFSTTSGDSATVVTALDNLLPDTERLNAAMEQLTPAIFTSLAIVQEGNDTKVQSTFIHRLQELYNAECSGDWHDDTKVTVWFEPFGDYSNQKTKHHKVGYHAKGGGAVAGSDFRVVENFYAGVAGAYSYSDVHWVSSRGRATINSYYGGTYATWRPEHYYVDASFIGAYNDYDEHRNISFPGIHRHAKSTHGGYELSGHLGTGLLFPVGKFEFQPFLRGAYVYIHEGDYTERGASSLNLHIKEKNSDLWRGEAGLNISACFFQPYATLIPSAHFSWVWEERRIGKHMNATLPVVTCGFQTSGMNPHRSLAQIGLGFTTLVADDTVAIGVLYECEFGDRYWDNELNLRVGVGF